MANYAIPPAGSAASSSVANVVVTVSDPGRLIAGTSALYGISIIWAEI